MQGAAMSTASPPSFGRLPVPARACIAGVALAAAGAVAIASVVATERELDIALLALCLLACAGANLFEVFAPGHFSLQPNLVPFVWGAALLPPELIPALALASFLPGWFVRRPPWFMPAFNVANYVLAGAVLHIVASAGGAFTDGLPDIAGAAALLAGAAALVYVNHALIGCIAGLASGRPTRAVLFESVRLRGTAGGRMIDIALATTGACLGALWAEAPGYAPLAVGPIMLMGLVVWVPMLRHESRIDGKTGLFNAGHLLHLLEDAVESAQRHETTLAIVMADLDHMRAINNRFGHLEGDRMIRAAADVLKRVAAGGNGIAARFGGEEFCLLLPGATEEEAREAGEELRAGIQQVVIGEGVVPTVSVGVAMFPDHGDNGEDLMHAADLALYDAKLGGRNRVRVALSASTRAMLGLQADAATKIADAPRWAPEPHEDRPTFGPTPGSIETEPSSQATPSPDETPTGLQHDPRDGEPEEEPTSRRWLVPYSLLLCTLTFVVALVSPVGVVVDRWEQLLMLVGMVLLLDLVRLDLFERVQISPASMPVVALAAIFGPLGPIAAEAAIALVRATRRVPAVKFSFDFGALSLSGAAAAVVFDIGPGHGAAAIGMGVLAGLAYYLVNAPLLALVIGIARGSSPIANFREQLAWLAPHYAAYGLLAAAFVLAERQLGLFVGLIYVVPVGILWVAERQYVERSRASVTALRAKNTDLEQANDRLRSLLNDNESLLQRIHHSYLSTITSLARTIEARDPYTGGHTERVGQLTRLIATELGYAEADLRALEVGAVMHDIGKIGIPDRILLKEGPLTPDERAEMQKHPEISSYILGELEMPQLCKQMARSHHERFDGGGYPDGLVGEEIPLPARILTVADTLDAITSDRPYRAARSIPEALEILDENAGSQFCPRVVAALHAVLARDPDLRDGAPAQQLAS
jgi:diguanylate cyclase (GGDEF)-like protein